MPSIIISSTIPEAKHSSITQQVSNLPFKISFAQLIRSAVLFVEAVGVENLLAKGFFTPQRRGELVNAFRQLLEHRE